MPEVYVDRDGRTEDGRTFPLTLAGAVVTVEDEDPAPLAPNVSDSKDVWVAYAVSRGYDESEGLKKDELIDRYGG